MIPNLPERHDPGTTAALTGATEVAEVATLTRTLLEDGSLSIEADRETWAAVEPWIPRVPRRDEAAVHDAAARIRVESALPEPPPAGAPALELRSVGGWVLPSGAVALAEPGGRIGGTVDPAALRASLRLAPGETTDALATELSAALTIAAALLLTRLGRALVHAAAVVAPDGRAWLLAGGTFSGKTTTCLNLIRAGWDYLADDHVVLHPGAGGGIRVEGWPRRFNLDHGYAGGASVGVRSRVDPTGFGPGHWRPTAPLAGLLFPRVEAERPTALAPLHPAAALALVLRHSPWLLADRAGAAPILALLERAARLPAHQLRLGRDCYCDTERLQIELSLVI
jgi:hypothetical protein